MRCLMLARWRANPYQKLLVEQLVRLGVDVEERPLHVRTLAHTLREVRPDVLHLQTIHTALTGGGLLRSLAAVAIFVATLLVARMRGIRIVWTMHDRHNHKNLHPRLDRWVTAMTARIAHACIAHCGRTDGKTHVLPHGHYIDHYENTNARAGGQFTFLFFGWLRPYKGVTELIEAFERLDTARLIIAGGVGDEAYVNAIRAKAAANPRIALVAETIPDDEVQAYFNASDVVVLPYRDILTSGAAILAMSFGRACIAPRIGCLAEMLDERGAFLYDGDGLFEAMSRALRSRGALDEMGKHNHAKVKEWTWERVADETLAIYRGITPARESFAAPTTSSTQSTPPPRRSSSGIRDRSAGA